MGQKVSKAFSDEIKSIEYQIFDKSFKMIEKYIKTDTKGLRDAFNREYEWVLINEEDGELNWHKIMPKQMKGYMGTALVQAIQTIGQLVKEAEQESSRSDYRFKDKSNFREIYRLIDTLIDLRERQQNTETKCCFFINSNPEEDQNQMFIGKAWDEFRAGHD